MNENIIFDEYIDKLRSYPSIMLIGDTGAGKTTLFGQLYKDYSVFLNYDLGSVQSTKVSKMAVQTKNQALGQANIYILWKDVPGTKDMHEVLMDELMKQVANYAGKLNEKNIVSIVQSFLTGGAGKAYDVSEYIDENTTSDLTKGISELIEKVSDSTSPFDSTLLESAEKEFRHSGGSKSKEDVYRLVFAKRLTMLEEVSNAENLWGWFNKAVEKIISCIRETAMDAINSICSNEKGSPLSVKSTFSLNEVQPPVRLEINDIFTSADKEHIKEQKKAIRRFLNEISGKNGMDLIIKLIIFELPFSNEFDELPFSQNTNEPKKLPGFSIYDVKGLETDSDTEHTKEKVLEFAPDAVVALHDITKPQERFTNICDLIKATYFKKLERFISKQKDSDNLKINPSELIVILNTKCDIAIENHARNYCTREELNYSELDSDEKKDVYSKAAKHMENDLIGKAACTLFPDTVAEINTYLDDTKKISHPLEIIKKLLITLRDNISTTDMLTADEVKIVIDEEKLRALAERIIAAHNAEYGEYASQRDRNVHWKTRDAFKGYHMMGSGWTSNAKVYANININVGAMISKHISSNEVSDLIKLQKISSTTCSEKDIDAFKSFYENFRTRFDWKIRGNFIKSIVYENASDEAKYNFLTTVSFMHTIDWITELLVGKMPDKPEVTDTTEYWMDAIRTVLSRYANEIKYMTFIEK